MGGPVGTANVGAIVFRIPNAKKGEKCTVKVLENQYTHPNGGVLPLPAGRRRSQRSVHRRSISVAGQPRTVAPRQPHC